MTMRGLLRCVSTGACRVAPGAVAEPVPASPGSTGGKVPAGHVPVEVSAEGEETQRFVVPAKLLGRPPIAELLRRAAPRRSTATRAGDRSAHPLPAAAHHSSASDAATPPPPSGCCLLGLLRPAAGAAKSWRKGLTSAGAKEMVGRLRALCSCPCPSELGFAVF